MPKKEKKVTQRASKKTSKAKSKKAPVKKAAKKVAKSTKKEAQVVAQAATATATAGAGAQISISTPTVSSGAIASGSSLKNFKHHPDIENFYRFIYENDLRFEALAILDEMLTEKRNRKALKAAKQKAH